MAFNGGDKIKLMEPKIEEMEKQRGIYNRIKTFLRETRRKNFIKNQLERISIMTLSDMIMDPMVEILIFRYLLKEHQLGILEIKTLWQCYKISEKILWNTDLINDREIIESLLRTCPPIIWEHDIINLAEQSKKHKNHKHIVIMIKKLMDECIMDMECTTSYYSFYSDIAFRAKKLKKYLGELFDDIEFYKENKIPIHFEQNY